MPLVAMVVYAGSVQRTEWSSGFLHNMEMNLLSFPFESGAIWFVLASLAVVGGVFALARRRQPNADAATRAGMRAHSDVLLREEYEARRTSEGLVALRW